MKSALSQSGSQAVQSALPTHTNSGVVFDGVSMSFETRKGRQTALSDISLKIDPQHFVAIIGPSGCGKTTLLRLANGLLEPDTGTVSVSGAAPRPGPHAGFVFQGCRLIPWRTVHDNVGFALEGQRLPRAERHDRVTDFLGLVGLSRYAAHYPSQLSGGMQQRVALARALVSEPGVLLMDEPFASLDAQTRELMQVELISIWTKRQPTVLFVTHSVDEALALADTVVVMGHGRVLETLKVDFPRPRDNSAIRAETGLNGLRDHLWSRIRDLVLSDPASPFYGRLN